MISKTTIKSASAKAVESLQIQCLETRLNHDRIFVPRMYLVKTRMPNGHKNLSDNQVLPDFVGFRILSCTKKLRWGLRARSDCFLNSVVAARIR